MIRWQAAHGRPLLVGHTEQVGVEVVEVGGLVAAGVAAPGVSLRVEPLVEEI